MRELILNADDYGRSTRVNKAIEKLVLGGRITSFTVLASMTRAADVTRFVGKVPADCSIGLHLNLTEGRPVMACSRVSTLVQNSGLFFPPNRFVRRLLGGKISYQEIRAEFRAQIEAMQGLVGAFTHFDSHHHVHRFPGVMAALAATAAETGAPNRIRTNRRWLASSGPRNCCRLRLWSRHLRARPWALLGLCLKYRQKRLLSRHRFLSPDYLLTPVPAIEAFPVVAACERWGLVLSRLAQGCYELNFHPGVESREEEVINSPGFARSLSDVTLVSYKKFGVRG